MDSSSNIHKDHRKRMRERFDEVGFEGWSKVEVIEYMLYNVYKQGDTNVTAHNLLDYSGKSMSALLDNSIDMRMSEDVPNVGEKTVLFLRSLKEFVKYCNKLKLEEKPVTLTRETFFDIVGTVELSDEIEDVAMICLDKFMRVKNVVKLTDASDAGFAKVRIDRMVHIAARNKASNVVLVHTHPSGAEEVSKADIEMTEQADKILAAINILLVDHFIISGDKLISIKLEMSRRGDL